MNLLTAKEVSEMLNCSPSYVLKITRTGRLPAVNLATGTRRAEWRYRPDDVHAWINNNTHSTGSHLPLLGMEKPRAANTPSRPRSKKSKRASRGRQRAVRKAGKKGGRKK